MFKKILEKVDKNIRTCSLRSQNLDSSPRSELKENNKKGCICSINNLKWIFLFIIGIIIGILIGYLVDLRQPEEVKYPTKTEIAAELETFIREFLINEDQTLKLIRTEKVNSLIRVYFELDGRPLSIYTTKDGAFLIDGRGVVNLEERRAEVEWQRKSDQFQAALTPERKVKIAQCLTERGFRVYVADWCPFCRQQKELFGEAAKYLTSIDCFNPDGEEGNIAKCPHIQGVPAWKDGEGKILPYEGMLCIKRLVNLSGCEF